MFVKIIIAFVFYLIYWLCCFLSTGTDKKNLLGLRSYPDDVQNIVKKNNLWHHVYLKKNLFCQFLLVIYYYSL